MSKSAPGSHRATYDDLRRAPEHRIAELIGGELHVAPRPTLDHSAAATMASGQLSEAYDRRPGGPRGPGGWWIRFEPELHVGEDVLVPDLAGWRRARLSSPPSGPFVATPPDFVAEVLSPSTAGRDRVVKMAIYARENVRHVWLIDPGARVVEVFRLEEGRWMLAAQAAGNTLARLEPFEAIELELERWWGERAEDSEG